VADRRKAPARRQAGGGQRLAKEAWVRAALAALVNGFDRVHVEHLALDLGVTKGSFYWHFADRGALLDAVAERWEEVATSAIIAQVGTEGGADARFARLLALATTSNGARLEGAMRAWGAVEPRIGAIVARVDRRRERFVVELFEEMGFTSAEAADRTRALYLALIGELTRVSHGAPASGKTVWRAIHRLLTSR
jgi:AcrR family transcriptional regulator